MTKLPILALLIISIFTSCADETINPTGKSGVTIGTAAPNNNPNNQTPSASAFILGRKIDFTYLSANISGSSTTIQLANPVGVMVTFEIQEPIDERDYTVWNTNIGYYVGEDGVDIFSSSNSNNTGLLYITELNAADNYISGTFSFSACMGPGTDCLTVESGSFNRVPITN